MKSLTFKILLLFFALVIVAVLYFSWRSPIAKALSTGERINALIIGTDLVDRSRHTDTLVFISYAPSTGFLDMISIPRDTHFSPTGYNFKKINEIFAYNYAKTRNSDFAARQVRDGIEELFQNKVKIPYYFQIDYKNFKDILDIIGGVPLNVELNMNYQDKTGDLNINLSTGTQLLNGQKALEYVRFRSKEGDLGRITRQQKFIKAFLDKVKKPSVIWRLPQISSLVLRDVKTNLNSFDIFSAALELRKLQKNNIRTTQVPGNIKGSYWQPNAQNTIGLFEKIFSSSETTTTTEKLATVEVWNASGKKALAERVMWMLRKNGFDVIDWGTLKIIQENTTITDFSGNIKAAQKLQGLIKCGDVISKYDSADGLVEIKVILGSDCQFEYKEQN